MTYVIPYVAPIGGVFDFVASIGCTRPQFFSSTARLLANRLPYYVSLCHELISDPASGPNIG